MIGIILLFVVVYPGVWVLTVPHLRPSYRSRSGSFFISLIVENLCASLQVILVDSFSVNSCDFALPLGGGELRAFLPDRKSVV